MRYLIIFFSVTLRYLNIFVNAKYDTLNNIVPDLITLRTVTFLLYLKLVFSLSLYIYIQFKYHFLTPTDAFSTYLFIFNLKIRIVQIHYSLYLPGHCYSASNVYA
jgi:hypothetical protein